MAAYATEDRDTWGTRCAYWMAAIGSAVGLGNIWRFPNQVFTNGGGAFLVAYFLVLLLIGMPMLLQEMALGQKFRGGDIEAYGRINRRFRGVGLASVFGAFIIVTYYTVIISWSVRYFVGSFESPLPWAYDEHVGTQAECIQKALNYEIDPETGVQLKLNRCFSSAPEFFNRITKDTGTYKSDGEFAWEIFGCLVFTWICIYISVFKGVKSVGMVVWVTMPLPVLFLLIMLIKALTLPGSGDGISQYLTTDLGQVADAQVWIKAVGQCFFSLSVCMGVMTAYSSFTKSGSVACDEKVVALSDVSIAFLSGFVIYGVLGFLSGETKSHIPDGDTMVAYDDWLSPSTAGPNLVFVAFPTALLQFKASAFFSAIFFFALFTLGIDSAFSMIEASCTVLADSDFAERYKLSRPVISGTLCTLGFLFAIPFCMDNGSYHLGVVDNYVSTNGMVFIGALEAFALGWWYLREENIKRVGQKAVDTWTYGYWITMFLAVICGLAGAVPNKDDTTDIIIDYSNGLGDWSVFIAVGIAIIGWGGSSFLAIKSAKEHAASANQPTDTKAILWGIFGWFGCEDIRQHVNTAGGEKEWSGTKEQETAALLWDCSKLSIVWGFLIKYLIPGFLLTLLSAQLRDECYKTEDQLRPEHRVEGAFPLLLMMGIVLVVAIFPSLMEQSWDNMTPEEREKAMGKTAKNAENDMQDVEMADATADAGNKL